MSACIPASFLPPPKREKKSFDDEVLFEPVSELPPGTSVPGGRDQRLAELEDEALRLNPECGKQVPWPVKRRRRSTP